MKHLLGAVQKSHDANLKILNQPNSFLTYPNAQTYDLSCII